MKRLRWLLLGFVAFAVAPSRARADAPPPPRLNAKPMKHERGGPAAAPSAPDGGPSARASNRNAVKELFQELRTGKLSKEELKQKLAQLRDTAVERRKEHREELGKRWGTTLAKAPARDELKVHARRMAFLNRALVLAQSDTGPDKEKTIARINKLIDKENARHDQAMTRFQSQAVAAASAPAPAVSVASDGSGGSK